MIWDDFFKHDLHKTWTLLTKGYYLFGVSEQGLNMNIYEW